ncbi:MAG: FG-GAP-like repeat-containing protein [Candidatus Marinimicrobia bacterium]|nr:FG-GAP-like repeat-containing protein [Candidatus Neomarinimicrobiota bacterium]
MLYLLFVITFSLCQDVPFIESIDPAFGELGSTIIINGSNFSAYDEDNTVFFGGLEANILNATENELMVTVPYGAYYIPISVYTNGLYAVSNQQFDVIFDSAEELTVSHLSNQLDNPFLGAKYYDVKIADLNGDEIPEILTSEAGSGSSAYLAIFKTSFDDGMISIDDRLEINFGTGVYSSPHDIALGDLNGDGLLDVVVSEYGDITDDFESHTCIFINTSHHQNFSFDSPIIVEGDGYEAYAQLQDINGDGKLDIVTSRTSWHQMGVYLNTTENDNVSFSNKIIIEDDDGTYTDGWLYVDTRPAFADLNGDGMIDMVTTAYSTDRRDVYIYSNISTEENIDFNLELIVQSGGEHADWPTDYDWSAYSPALADIDGDGRLDIIVANGTCIGCSPSGISILRNTSTESELLFEYEYSDFYQYQSNSVPVGIGISDLNGDGKPDLLTNDWMGGISIMVNSSTEGNIALEEQMILGIGSFPLSVATADLNMDSTPEIVVSNWDVEGLRIIHNFLPVGESEIQGDLNGDGMIDILDLIVLVNMILYGEYSIVADLNEDGVVNILDIIIYKNIILGN